MDFATIFNQMAFPVAACVAMGWYVKYTTDNHRQDVNQLNENHKKAEDNIVEAIHNNTLVMTRICERLEMEDKDGNND